MKIYELMLLVQGQIPEDLAKEVINKVKSMIKELGGQEISDDFWGRRKLAYKIGSQEHAYYEVLLFSILPDKVKKLENEIKLISEIIRYLFTKKDMVSAGKKESNKQKSEKVKKTVKKQETKEGDKPKKEEEIKEKEIKEEKIEKTEKKESKEEERLQELDKKIDEILKD